MSLIELLAAVAIAGIMRVLATRIVSTMC